MFRPALRSWLPRKLQVEQLEDRCNPSAIHVDTENFAQDRVLVTFQTGYTSEALAGAPGIDSLQYLGGQTYLVKLTDGHSVDRAIGEFAGKDGVLFAEPDYTIGVKMVPNDPGYSNGSLWGLNNTGQSSGLNDADIDAPEGWDVGRGTGQTIVAVIDSGVDYNHQDLNANMWRNPGEIAGDGIDNDANGFVDDVYGADFVNNDGNPMDDNNHGTHVAGTIGAVGNNGLGSAGVAWNTRIMALKFLDASGSGSTSNAIRAIDYAIAKGAKILNNSWGGGGASQALQDAITRAQTAGVIFVAAAGNAATNNDTTATYPANYTGNNIVVVASSTRTDALSSFSNYGATKVHLAAPGSSIYSTLPNNTYGTLSGTSMATPHVVGALAAFWDANPTLTHTQVITQLKSTVDPLAGLAGKVSTGGRLNFNTLMRSTVPPVVPPPPPPPPSDVTGAKVTTGTFSGATATSWSKVRLTFNEAIQTASFTAADVVAFTGPTGGSIAATGVTAVAGTNNTQFDVAFANQTTFGNYTITLGTDILDVAGNKLNQDGDAINGETTADRAIFAGALSPGVVTFAYTGSAAAITDNKTTTVNIVVPAGSNIANLAITDINVGVTLTHTYDGDLSITLTSPSGKSISLFNRRGGSGDNLSSTVFDDEASKAISAGAAPFTGSFRPEALLSGFDGLNATGTWKLAVRDNASRDTGSLKAASIIITTGNTGYRVQTLGFLGTDGDESIFAPKGYDFAEVQSRFEASWAFGFGDRDGEEETYELRDADEPKTSRFLSYAATDDWRIA